MTGILPLAVALTLGLPSQAPLLDLHSQSATLDNGLRVITVQSNSPGVVTYYTMVEVGVRNEHLAAEEGLSHLLEHLMFRGTENLSEEEYRQTIQALGADNNAQTEQDHTLYTVVAPKGALPEIIELESERMMYAKTTEAQFRAEARAVLGEYEKSMASPLIPLWESLSALAFDVHPYAHTALGPRSAIESMGDAHEATQTFMKQHYTPDNTVVVVVGDLEHETVLSHIEKRYGGWSGSTASSEPTREPPQTSPRHTTLSWPTPMPPVLALGYRVPGVSIDSAQPVESLYPQAALHLIQTLLFAESAPFYRSWHRETGRVLDLQYWEAKHHLDAHLFLASFTLHPKIGSKDLLAGLQQTLDGIANGEIDVAQLERARTHLRYRMALELETPADIAKALATWSARGGNAKSLEHYAQAIASVPLSFIASMARTYLRVEHRNVVELSSHHAEAKL